MNAAPAFNSRLKAWLEPRPTGEPGAGRIEEPGRFGNLVWQTRPRETNEYERSLVAALERVFGEGAVELPDVVAGLNALGLRDHAGHAWTEDSFRQALAALGY